MKKNDVVDILDCNNNNIKAVIITIISSFEYQTIYLCYGNGEIFTIYEHSGRDDDTGEIWTDISYGTSIAKAILPDYDIVLKDKLV